MRKILAVAGCIVLGGALLIGSAFAQGSQAIGFEVYMQALKNTKQFNNATVTVKTSVVDNGEQLLNSQAIIKADRDSKLASGVVSVEVGAESQMFEIYKQDDQVFKKLPDSDQYQLVEKREGKSPREGEGRHHHGHGNSEGMAMLTQAVFGDLKNNLQLTELTDGNKKVSLILEDNQIPTIIKAVGAIAISHGSGHKAECEHPWHSEGMPSLVSNITLNKVSITVDITEDDIITGKQFMLVVAGLDNEGVSHVVNLDMDIAFTDFDSTSIERLDLTGIELN